MEIDYSIKKTLSFLPRESHIALEISVLHSSLFFCESGYSFTTREWSERAVEKGLSSSRRPKGAEKRQLFRKHTPLSSSKRFTRCRERWCIAT